MRPHYLLHCSRPLALRLGAEPVAGHVGGVPVVFASQIAVMTEEGVLAWRIVPDHAVDRTARKRAKE